MGSAAIVLALLLSGQAQSAADEDLGAEVRRLVRQLDAAQLAEREAAEQGLVKLGPRILDLLPPTDRASAEVKQRLTRVRQKLQRAAAEAAAKASLITLRGDALTLPAVLTAMQEQSGNKLSAVGERGGQAAGGSPLKIAFDNTPFWQALDQVLDQAGLTVYPFGEQRSIKIVARQPGRRPRAESASYAGPLRIEPTSVVAQRDLRDPGGEVLKLALEVAWEPRLRPISLKQRLSELKALDERGRPVAVDDTQAELEVPTIDESIATSMILPFKLPSRDVKQIAELRGTLEAMIPGKIETFRFDNLTAAKNVEQRVAGVTVTLEEVRKNNDLWQVRMVVKFDEAGEALQSHQRNWVLKNDAYLEGPDGKPLQYDVLETTRVTQNEVGVSYGFDLKEPPTKCKFVYKTPGVIMATKSEYQLKGIRLP